MNNEECYHLALKAKRIALSIGNPIIIDDYYSDETIGYSYVYDKFSIDYYYKKGETIEVKIDGITILTCDFNTKKVTYKQGNYSELIETIYDQIPQVLYKRKQEAEDYYKKKEELESMKEYFAYYINCRRNKEALDILNDKLDMYRISVYVYESRSTFVNKVTGEVEESAVPTYTYTVYFEGNEVAIFNGNTFNMFPNIEYYTNQFKPGKWTSLFKSSVLTSIDETTNRKRIERSSDDIIRKFKKEYSE